ncbi:MAG: hypothetical protein HYS81_05460 [Candidatus Aenigmatarchaeota archaeon]|nr:MAG: hypothetical protein HYS81_05460 [Candidatus Aenigmarchaeota archaeon]
MNDRGFIHVLEAVLVALILIATLPFLLFPIERETAWDVARLTVAGEDALATLNGIYYGSDNESFAQDILEENVTTVDATLQRVIGSQSMGYGVRIVGSLKNEVRVGCNCTQDEANILEQSLTPANVNGRRIIFRVFPLEYERLGVLDFDVIVANGTAQADRLNDFYVSSIGSREVVLNHLRKKHGIVEIADLSSTDLSKAVQKDIFGLASGSGGGGDIIFANAANTIKSNYAIGKYFYGVGFDMNFTGVSERNFTLRTYGHPVRKHLNGGAWNAVDIDLNRNGTYDHDEWNFGEGDAFDVSLDGTDYNLTVDKIDAANNFVHFNLIRGPGEYAFTDFVGSDPVAVAPHDGNNDRVVAGVSGNRNGLIIREYEGGRPVWISEGSGDDHRGLLKSAIIWAAGEDWNLLPRSVSARQVRVSYYVVQGEEFLEPYWIELTLWNVF